MRKIESLQTLEALLEDEEAVVAFFERFRWVKGFCPYCGDDRRYDTSKDGTYKCAKCRLRYSVQTRTIFQNSKVPLRVWLLAIWYVTYQRCISSTELAKALGVTQKTAWLMLNRLYQASRTRSFKKPPIDDEEFDFPVLQMLSQLSDNLNSVGLGDGDRKRADRFMGRLYDQKPYMDPAKIRRWAMRNWWDFESAAQLEGIARTYRI